MKLNYIESNTTLGGHRALFGLLREQNDLSNHHIFIVPDRYTLSVEKDICEILYPDGAFNVDVCSFTRLAQKALGNKNKSCLSKEGTVLLLNRVICENNDKLGYYKNIKSVSFSREMFASIAALRSSSITPDEIEEKVERIGGTVADKLRDIAVIYRAYDKALRSEFMDTITRVDWLKDHIGEVDFVKESHIYILGFNVYSEQQINVIKRMLMFCPSVNIAFCKSTGGSNSFCYPSQQEEKILDFCRECGIPTFKRESVQVLGEPFDFLHNELFGFSQEKIIAANDRLKVCGYDNIYEEVKAVAREILYLVRKENYRYRDIAVVANNESYNVVLRKIFDRYGITYFIDEKYAVKNTFFATYIRKVAVAAESGFDRRAVMAVVRHPYFGFDRDHIQKFENYCTKYNVNYNTIDKPFIFEDCPEAEEVRKKAVDVIGIFPSRGLVSEFCDKIISFKEDPCIVEKEKEYFESDVREQRIYSDKEKFIGVINEIGKLCGEREVELVEFISMIDSVLENMTVSILPQYIDSVFIGNTEESRFSGVKTLFVVGANDGYFPMTSGDKLIFGCYDTTIMKINGLSVYPSPEESNLFEQFAIIDLLSKTSRIYLSYMRNCADGTQFSEGNGIREIKSRLSLKEKQFVEYHGFDDLQKLLYELGTKENCLREFLSSNIPKEYVNGVKKYLLEQGLIEEREEKEGKFDLTDGYERNKQGDLKMSVSKMETFFKCPFKNYLTNVLKLKEKEIGGLRVNNKGSIIHGVLERFFKKDIEYLRNATDDQIKEEIEEAINFEFSKTENQRFKDSKVSLMELNGIADECRFALKILTDNFKKSEFNPTWIEKKFGDYGEIAIEIGNKRFIFTGYVDRVDLNGKNIVIIDYKTGKVDDSLNTVYTGEKIQLYLYLKYFLDKGYKPVGVFYMPFSDGYKKKKTSYAMRGQMLNSIEMFESLDKRISDTREPKYCSPNIEFTVETKSGNKVFGRKNSKNLIYEKDFTEITKYVMELCKKGIEEITEGYMERKPTSGACQYCAYSKICGEVEPRKEVKASIGDFVLRGEKDVQVE